MKLYTCTISEHETDDILTMFSIEGVALPNLQSSIGHYYAKKFIADEIISNVKSVEFKYTKNGKPYYDDTHQFNISHSGDYVFVAYSEKPVGIDGELVRKINPRFIYKVLSDGEIENNADFSIEFLKAWTVKEAYLKLLGEKMGNLQSITKRSLSNENTIITNVTEDYIMSAVYQN